VLKREFGCLLAFPNQITHRPWKRSQKTAEKGGKRQRLELKEKEQKAHKQTNRWKNQPNNKK
jgi:hypothetical protein